VSWSLLGLWASFYVALIGFQGLTPIYAGGSWYGDWWEHYAIAQVYLGTGTGYATVWFGDYNLASRTPLFNLAAAFGLSVFGDRFWVYQVASTFLNSLFVVPLYLLARALCGLRAALLCAGLVFFDTWLVHQGTFTWTKLSCAYLLLLALGFSIRFRAAGDPRLLYASALCGARALRAIESRCEQCFERRSRPAHRGAVAAPSRRANRVVGVEIGVGGDDAGGRFDVAHQLLYAGVARRGRRRAWLRRIRNPDRRHSRTRASGEWLKEWSGDADPHCLLAPWEPVDAHHRAVAQETATADDGTG